MKIYDLRNNQDLTIIIQKDTQSKRSRKTFRVKSIKINANHQKNYKDIVRLKNTSPIEQESTSSEEIEKIECSHPLKNGGYEDSVKIFPSSHVTSESGTGFVHIAPNHGIEDFEVGKKFNIQNLPSVSEKGLYTENINDYFPTYFLISLSFIKASTGVRVFMSKSLISSLICSRTGSSS